MTMRTKKASPRRRMVHPTATARRRSAAHPTPAARLRQGWNTTVATLTAAEQKAEREVRRLVKRNRHEFEARLSALQARLRKEQKGVARMVNDTVHGALAALDMPSRREVAELTRKVDHLTRKVESVRRPRAKA
jgi:hypothetical protein